MGTKLPTLEPGMFYHVFNRALGTEPLFRFSTDYLDWTNALEEYLLPVAEIHAYNLLPNHFHLMIRLKDSSTHEIFSKEINRLQSQYARHYNRKYGRMGGLFHRPFGRKIIKDDAQLAWLLWYIHRNPLHHNITDDWDKYPYSSYPHYLNNASTLVTTEFLIAFFGGIDHLLKHHQMLASDFKNHFGILTGE